MEINNKHLPVYLVTEVPAQIPLFIFKLLWVEIDYVFIRRRKGHAC